MASRQTTRPKATRRTLMRTTEQIVSDIRRISQRVVEPSDEAVLECAIQGPASGIPGAFIDALDRVDPSCRSSESLHELLVEYADTVATSSRSVLPKSVILTFSSGQTFVSTK